MNFFWLCYFPQTKLLLFNRFLSFTNRILTGTSCIFLFISRPHYSNWRHKLQFAIERQIQSYVFRRNHHIEFDVCNHISILSWNFFLLQYLIKIQFVLNLCAYSDSKTVFIGESWLLAKFNRIACLVRKKEHQLLCTASKCVCSYMRCTKCVLFVCKCIRSACVSCLTFFFRFRCLFICFVQLLKWIVSMCLLSFRIVFGVMLVFDINVP